MLNSLPGIWCQVRKKKTLFWRLSEKIICILTISKHANHNPVVALDNMQEDTHVLLMGHILCHVERQNIWKLLNLMKQCLFLKWCRSRTVQRIENERGQTFHFVCFSLHLFSQMVFKVLSRAKNAEQKMLPRLGLVLHLHFRCAYDRIFTSVTHKTARISEHYWLKLNLRHRFSGVYNGDKKGVNNVLLFTFKDWNFTWSTYSEY